MFKRHAAFPLLVLVLAGSVQAQESIGTLQGQIRDTTGKPVAKARVWIKGAALLTPREARTNEEGQYRLQMLPPGAYEVLVSRDGHISSSVSFYLGVGQTCRQDVVLRLQAVAEQEVVVVAGMGAIDKTETKTATNINAETLQNLPTSVSAYGALSVAPGITGATDHPQIRGAVAGQSAFTVNGINAKDAFYKQGRQFELVMDDMIEDIQVIQSPMNARYGNTGGGMVNVVTKTGSNAWSGAVKVKLSSPSWSGLYGTVPNRTATALVSTGNNVANDALGRTWETTLSGPIIKDHLTFSYGTRLVPVTRQTASLYNPVVPNNYMGLPIGGATASRYGVDADGNSATISRPTDSHFHDLKLFWNIDERQNLELIVSRSGWKGISVASNLVQADANLQQRWTNQVLGLNYRSIIGDAGLLDIRFGTRDVDIWQASGPGIPIWMMVWKNGTLPYLEGLKAQGYSHSHAYYSTAYNGYIATRLATEGAQGPPNAEKKYTQDLNANFTWVSERHSMDAGLSSVRTQYIYPEAWGPTNTVYSSPGKTADGRYIAFNYYKGALWNTLSDWRGYYSGWYGLHTERYRVMTTGDPDELGKATTESVWVNDLWRLSDHLSLMGGLRLNRWRLSDRSGERIRSRGFEPRFEAKYDLDGTGKRLVSATYGVFTSAMQLGDVGSSLRLPGNIVQRAFWNVGADDSFYLVSKADIYNDGNYKAYSYTDTNRERSVNPELRPSTREEFTLNFRRALEGGGSLRASAVYSRVKDQYYYRGINTMEQLPSLFQGVEYAVTPKIYTRVLDFDPHARRVHRGFEFEFDVPLLKGTAHRIDLAGNWTINRDKGRSTFREGADGDPGARFNEQLQAKGIPLDVYNPYGEIAASIHSVARGWITWTALAQRGASSALTLMVNYTSGSPYSMTITYDIPFKADFVPSNNALTSGQTTTFTVFYGERGRFYSPETYSADLKWNLEILLVNRLKLRAFLAIFNIFNTQLASSYNAYGYNKADLSYGDGKNLSYRATLDVNDMRKYGTPNFTAIRSADFAVGLKF